MSVRSKVIVCLVPLALWTAWAGWFELQWRGVEHPGTGQGYGAWIIYLYGLPAALLVSSAFGLVFYVRRSKP